MENMNVFDMVAFIVMMICLFGCLFLLFFLDIRYTSIKNQKQEDFIDSLDNEHDKSICLDYEKNSKISLKDFVKYRSKKNEK